MGSKMMWMKKSCIHQNYHDMSILQWTIIVCLEGVLCGFIHKKHSRAFGFCEVLSMSKLVMYLTLHAWSLATSRSRGNTFTISSVVLSDTCYVLWS